MMDGNEYRAKVKIYSRGKLCGWCSAFAYCFTLLSWFPFVMGKFDFHSLLYICVCVDIFSSYEDYGTCIYSIA